jgi:hypothetical protein
MSVAVLESSHSAILAAFLLAASKANAHWYSVKCLSEGIPSLPDLFGISDNKLNEFLVLSGFANRHKQWKRRKRTREKPQKMNCCGSKRISSMRFQNKEKPWKRKLLERGTSFNKSLFSRRQMSRLSHHHHKNDNDEDELCTGVMGSNQTSIDMSRYIVLPKSEQYHLESDKHESGARIAKVGFDPETGEWYYMTMRSNKIAPNHISTVLGTLLELSESLTAEELQYCMSVPSGSRDTYRKDLRGMLKQVLEHQTKQLHQNKQQRKK